MRRSHVPFISAAVATVAAVGLCLGAAPIPSDAARVEPHQPASYTLVARPCPIHYKKVVLTITDFGMRTATGENLPKCLRVKATATLQIVNNASGDATVTFAGDTNQMVTGEMWNYAPVGDWFGPGAKLTFSVDELAASATHITIV